MHEVAIARPKGRETGMAYVQKYIEDAKSEGLFKAAVQTAGLRGATQVISTTLFKQPMEVASSCSACDTEA